MKLVEIRDVFEEPKRSFSIDKKHVPVFSLQIVRVTVKYSRLERELFEYRAIQAEITKKESNCSTQHR